MTAQETAEQLSTNIRVGYNLTMAREVLKRAITPGTMPQTHVQGVVDGYMAAFNEAFYGPEALTRIDEIDKAAEVVHGQFGCLATSQLVTVTDITEKIREKSDELELIDITENIIRDLINPLLAKI